MSYNKELNPMQALTESMTPKFAVSYLRVFLRVGRQSAAGAQTKAFLSPLSARLTRGKPSPWEP